MRARWREVRARWSAGGLTWSCPAASHHCCTPTQGSASLAWPRTSPPCTAVVATGRRGTTAPRKEGGGGSIRMRASPSSQIPHSSHSSQIPHGAHIPRRPHWRVALPLVRREAEREQVVVIVLGAGLDRLGRAPNQVTQTPRGGGEVSEPGQRSPGISSRAIDSAAACDTTAKRTSRAHSRAAGARCARARRSSRTRRSSRPHRRRRARKARLATWSRGARRT